MDVKIVVAFFMLGLFAKGHAQLYCYVCDDCADGNNLSEDFLISCGSDETTTTSEPGTSTVQTAEPPIETIAPTNPPPESSTSQTTEPPTEPPTNPPAETTVESTPDTPPEETTPQETTTQETVPTTQPTVEPSFTTPPTPDSPITTTAPAPVTENTNPPTEGTTATNPPEPPTTTDRPTGTPPSFETSRLQQNSIKQTAYNCYVLVNATQHVNRGCVAASRYPNDMCRIANGLVLPLECRVCDTDKCNSSSRTVLSVFLLVFSIGTILSL